MQPETVVAVYDRRTEFRLGERTPLLGKGGWMRPVRKWCEASLTGADGVVRYTDRLSVVERTTPAAPQR